jgi:hypothetical protein
MGLTLGFWGHQTNDFEKSSKVVAICGCGEHLGCVVASAAIQNRSQVMLSIAPFLDQCFFNHMPAKFYQG